MIAEVTAATGTPTPIARPALIADPVVLRAADVRPAPSSASPGRLRQATRNPIRDIEPRSACPIRPRPAPTATITRAPKMNAEMTAPRRAACIASRRRPVGSGRQFGSHGPMAQAPASWRAGSATQPEEVVLGRLVVPDREVDGDAGRPSPIRTGRSRTTCRPTSASRAPCPDNDGRNRRPTDRRNAWIARFGSSTPISSTVRRAGPSARAARSSGVHSADLGIVLDEERRARRLEVGRRGQSPADDRAIGPAPFAADRFGDVRAAGTEGGHVVVDRVGRDRPRREPAAGVERAQRRPRRSRRSRRGPDRTPR